MSTYDCDFYVNLCGCYQAMLHLMVSSWHAIFLDFVFTWQQRDIIASNYCWEIDVELWLVFITWCLYHMISSRQFINVNLRRSSPLLIYMNWCLYPVTLSRQFILGKFTQPFALFVYMMPVPSDIVASIYLWKIYAAFCFVYVHDASTQWHCRVYLSLEK